MDISTGYGKRRVVKGISISAGIGERVAIIGHNGAGKSTFLKALVGLVPLWTGSVSIAERRVATITPASLLDVGVVYVPQGNRVFGDLTVEENLLVGRAARMAAQELARALEKVLEIFPALADILQRGARNLSGGEKQMLALGRALMVSPRIMLLDEPSLGLSPSATATAMSTIQSVADRHGVTVLIVEQKIREVLAIADMVYVLRNGEVSFAGPPTGLDDEKRLREVYL